MSDEEREKLIAAINLKTKYPPSYFDSLSDKQLIELYEYHTLK